MVQVLKSKYDFNTTLSKLESSILSHNMRIVSRVNAQENLTKAGFRIGGNYIFEAFRPDFAYRLFQKDLRMGIEPPLRIYVFESGGEVYVEYFKPSEVFSKWGEEEISRELDKIFDDIVGDALT